MDAHAARARDPDDLLPQGNEVWQPAAVRAFERWLETHAVPAALYCHNDYVAFGAIEVLKRRGVEPGRDIDIIGYDNLEGQPGSAVERPVLTTVEHPYAEIGRHCAQRLLDQMLRGSEHITHELIPVRLIQRHTTRAPRSA